MKNECKLDKLNMIISKDGDCTGIYCADCPLLGQEYRCNSMKIIKGEAEGVLENYLRELREKKLKRLL